MRAALDLETLLHDTGALQQGHFSLSSGLHSSQYVQCALLLQHPDVAATVCSALAERFRLDLPEVVIGPAMGGMILAYEVARALGKRALFAERVDGAFQLRRSFEIRPGERTLIVEDVVTTGGSIQEVTRVVARSGGIGIGVGAIIDRSPHPLAFAARFEALLKIRADVSSPAECPLCRAGVPFTKPGSRPVAVTP